MYPGSVYRPRPRAAPSSATIHDSRLTAISPPCLPPVPTAVPTACAYIDAPLGAETGHRPPLPAVVKVSTGQPRYSCLLTLSMSDQHPPPPATTPALASPPYATTAARVDKTSFFLHCRRRRRYSATDRPVWMAGEFDRSVNGQSVCPTPSQLTTAAVIVGDWWCGTQKGVNDG